MGEYASIIVNAVVSIVSVFGGILTASKMTNYRIEQLEKKVDKHNNFAEKIPVIQEQIKVANHRIEDLEHMKN